MSSSRIALALASFLLCTAAFSQELNSPSIGGFAGSDDDYMFKSLYDFCSSASCADGGMPSAGLIFDAAGNLYGTTSGGGNSSSCPGGCGTVFRLSPQEDGTWKHTVLLNFNGKNGSVPVAGLIFDRLGNLYGTTSSGGNVKPCYGGCGTVFQLSPQDDGTWKHTVLFYFNGPNGEYPNAGIIFDADGNVYGTTYWGGEYPNDLGTVFRLSPRTDGRWKHTTLFSFGSGQGAYPAAGLVFDKAGNLYGTAQGIGNPDCSSGCGTVFRLSPRTKCKWKHTTLLNFNGRNGSSPIASLIFDAVGNLYGTTWAGGSPDCSGGGCGTVFRLSPGAKEKWKHKILFSGLDPPESYFVSSLLLGANGELYGTSANGGFGCGGPGCGTVFRLSPQADDTWNDTILYSFNGTTGWTPLAGLIFDSAGSLYGTTSQGGKFARGNVFELVKDDK